MGDNIIKYEDDYKNIFRENIFGEKCRFIKNTIKLDNNLIEFGNGVLFLNDNIFYPRKSIWNMNFIGTLRYLKTDYIVDSVKVQKRLVYTKKYIKDSTDSSVDFD